MGFLHFFKKNPKSESIFDSTEKPAVHENKSVKLSQTNVSSFNEPLDKLIDGDLPWGWIAHNRNFINKIEKEYSYFLHTWIEARSKSPRELYSALRSFVLYMEDVKKLCESKGECFEFWFNEILTGKEYLQKRRKELDDLSSKLFKSQEEYEQRQGLLSNIDTILWDFLISNAGILQKDLYKYFDASVKSDIQSLLYAWDKSGKIEREKVGNTYKIFIRQ